tara:strand:+ start:809 stop:1738 length:930 start_codon:yes stop_codon:yes gene_type:complete
MGAGGAQSTIRTIVASNNVFVLHGSKGQKIWKLLRVIQNSKTKMHLICWLYHASLVGCLIKLCFRDKIILSLNIRNGYANPKDIKFSTRFIVSLVSILSAGIECRVNFCSEQSITEHNCKGLFKKSNNNVVYNGIEQPSRIYTKNDFIVCIVARYEPQKNYKLVKETLPWFHKHQVALHILTDKKEELSKFLNFHDSDFLKVYDNSEISALEIMEISTHHMLLSSSEGFANVNLEALSRGCSLICTNVGDSKIFPNEWCTIVPSNASEILKNLNYIREKYDKKSFNDELEKKKSYMISNFPLKNECDYV